MKCKKFSWRGSSGKRRELPDGVGLEGPLEAGGLTLGCFGENLVLQGDPSAGGDLRKTFWE